MELYIDHQYKKAGRIVDITEKYIYIQISHSIQDDWTYKCDHNHWKYGPGGKEMAQQAEVQTVHTGTLVQSPGKAWPQATLK